MRTIEEQYRLLEELLAQARQRMKAGETEWVEFKANIGESRCSITYEGVGNYISGLSNSACLKYKARRKKTMGTETLVMLHLTRSLQEIYKKSTRVTDCRNLDAELMHEVVNKGVEQSKSSKMELHRRKQLTLQPS